MLQVRQQSPHAAGLQREVTNRLDCVPTRGRLRGCGETTPSGILG